MSISGGGEEAKGLRKGDPGELLAPNRQLSRLTLEKEAHVTTLLEWMETYEIPTPSLEDLPERLPKPPLPTEEIVKSGLVTYTPGKSCRHDNFGYHPAHPSSSPQ